MPYNIIAKEKKNLINNQTHTHSSLPFECRGPPLIIAHQEHIFFPNFASFFTYFILFYFIFSYCLLRAHPSQPLILPFDLPDAGICCSVRTNRSPSLEDFVSDAAADLGEGRDSGIGGVRSPIRRAPLAPEEQGETSLEEPGKDAAVVYGNCVIFLQFALAPLRFAGCL